MHKPIPNMQEQMKVTTSKKKVKIDSIAITANPSVYSSLQLESAKVQQIDKTKKTELKTNQKIKKKRKSNPRPRSLHTLSFQV